MAGRYDFGMKEYQNGSLSRVGILVLPLFSNLTLAAVMEPLRAANRMAGRPLFAWTILTEDGQAIVSSSGLRIAPDAAIGSARDFDMLFVVASYEAEASPKVRRFLRSGAHMLIGGMESAAYVLAWAGVLDGYRATTHWEDLGDFAERFPAVTVVPDRFVIDRRRVTSGGALPTLDLMLDLLRRNHGLGLALAVSSTFIYEQEHAGHDPQHMVAAGRLDWQDPVVVRAIRLMEANVETPLPIGEIAAQAGVGTRELLRRFTDRLGTSPKAYYVGLRLMLGRRLLEHTDRPMADIAAACGFASGSAFARAFRERYGVNPSAFRRDAGGSSG
jgi:transcriptional regulator GlxA family with amidase domain